MSLSRYSNFLRNYASKRLLTTSSVRLSDDKLFIHRSKDPDVDNFAFTAENIKVCFRFHFDLEGRMLRSF